MIELKFLNLFVFLIIVFFQFINTFTVMFLQIFYFLLMLIFYFLNFCYKFIIFFLICFNRVIFGSGRSAELHRVSSRCGAPPSTVLCVRSGRPMLPAISEIATIGGPFAAPAPEPLGQVFTPPALVDFILDQAGYVAGSSLLGTTLLEPACGETEHSSLPLLGGLRTPCAQTARRCRRRLVPSFSRTLSQPRCGVSTSTNAQCWLRETP